MADGQTFLTGFAPAFNQARANTEAQKADQENLMFKYKMDNLMEQKKKREAKSAVETENARKAKDLAGQMGDPDSAPIFYKEIANGVDYETVQKRIINGDYQKNSDYKAPTQTIKMPTAVTAQYDVDANPMKPSGTGILARGAQKQYDSQMESVNQKIDSIDPKLRSETVNPKEDYSVTQDDANAKYIYKPKDTFKLPDFNDSVFKYNKAVQSGDPVAIREATMELKTQEQALTQRATIEARAQGKNASRYFSLNPDGTVNSQFSGEMRPDGLYNISNPNNPQLVSSNVRVMDDKDMDEYNKIYGDISKKSQDYQASSANYTGALDTSQNIAQLLHDDRTAATTTSAALATIQSIGGEVAAIATSLNDQGIKINAKIASGDLNGIEKEMAEYTELAGKFASNGVLSDGNAQKAVNSIKYQSARTILKYQVAQANATDGKVSKNDLDNADRILGTSADPVQIIAGMQSALKGSKTRLIAAQRNIDQDPGLNDYENRTKIKTGLRTKRIGDQIMQMSMPEDQKKRLMQMNDNLDKDFAFGQAQTAASIQQQSQDQNVEFNGLVIPAEAVGILKGRPDQRTKDFFDSQFGKGAAERVLGGK